MIDISIPQQEIANLTRQVSKYGAKKEAELWRLIEYTALQIENTVKEMLNRKGTGRIYPGRSIPHQASSPGQPPAIQTGRLRNSIQTALYKAALAADVGTNVEYARHLEYGTVNMAARPFLRPAFLKHVPDFIREVKNIMSRP